MGTREKLLAFFEENKGSYFSGEELAARLSVSRTAVWKAVNSLRREGYEICGVSNKGYCLSGDADILSVQGISKYLKPVCPSIQIELLPYVDSTNDYLREQAGQGRPEGFAVIAGEQSRGKGRIGRSFYSPADTGIYMSFLLRPEDCPPSQAVKFTTMAAAALCLAIEKVSGKNPRIKWVNDIYLEKKKVSGILTEASVSLESGVLEYVILGVGINVYPPKEGFPGELEKKAGAVFEKKEKDGKNRLAAEFLNSFMDFYRGKAGAEYAGIYKSRSMVPGREIHVLLPEGAKRAKALELDPECRLLVEYEDGAREWLRAGEIRIVPEEI